MSLYKVLVIANLRESSKRQHVGHSLVEWH